ncbi:hypothetical protein PLESTF_000147800 [Pleodorina starrii]|nr:hypothetical protein PLESTF_000147800 [Pleodorina starrii]
MSQAPIADAAKAALKDASRFLFFNEQGTVLASSFTVDVSELKPLEALFNDRDEAIKHGMVVLGTRYEVDCSSIRTAVREVPIGGVS